MAKQDENSFEFTCEGAEDIWNIYNLIRVGDRVTSETDGLMAKPRIQLTLEVEAVDYDPLASSIHLRGKNILTKEYVYHTLDLALNRRFILWKPVWDSIDNGHRDEVLNFSKSADVAAVIMHEKSAAICVLTSTMTIVKAKIDMPVARKRKGSAQQHDVRFMDDVAQAFLRHINLGAMEYIIIASRGLLKEQFLSHLFEVADKQGKRFSSTDKSKFLTILHLSSGYKNALKEILADPAVIRYLRGTEAQAETDALCQVLKMLNNTDSSYAAYGFKHVSQANEKRSIDTLMLSDALLRSIDVIQRKQYIELVESVKNKGGTVLIFSSMHVSGQLFTEKTGVAAILRFSLPEIENDEEEDNDVLERDNDHLAKMFGMEWEVYCVEMTSRDQVLMKVLTDTVVMSNRSITDSIDESHRSFINSLQQTRKAVEDKMDKKTTETIDAITVVEKIVKPEGLNLEKIADHLYFYASVFLGYAGIVSEAFKCICHWIFFGLFITASGLLGFAWRRR